MEEHFFGKKLTGRMNSSSPFAVRKNNLDESRSHDSILYFTRPDFAGGAGKCESSADKRLNSLRIINANEMFGESPNENNKNQGIAFSDDNLVISNDINCELLVKSSPLMNDILSDDFAKMLDIYGPDIKNSVPVFNDEYHSFFNERYILFTGCNLFMNQSHLNKEDMHGKNE